MTIHYHVLIETECKSTRNILFEEELIGEFDPRKQLDTFQFLRALQTELNFENRDPNVCLRIGVFAKARTKNDLLASLDRLD